MNRYHEWQQELVDELRAQRRTIVHIARSPLLEGQTIRSHRRPRSAFWRIVWDRIGDLFIFALGFVVAMMAGSLFVYGTWPR